MPRTLGRERWQKASWSRQWIFRPPAKTRWIGATNPKISVATYDLDNVGVLKSPPYLAVGGENSSPWTKRTARFRKSLMRYEGEQLFPDDRTAPSEAALLVIAMNIAPEHESDFNE
jgi:hypothetical protein